jgi:hypothetical protein
MGTLTSYVVGALDAKSAENGSAGFSWINISSENPFSSEEFSVSSTEGDLGVGALSSYRAAPGVM